MGNTLNHREVLPAYRHFEQSIRAQLQNLAARQASGRELRTFDLEQSGWRALALLLDHEMGADLYSAVRPGP